MKLKIPNHVDIEELFLAYKPVTLEIYYSQFGRDLTQDLLDCLRKYGSLTRSLSLRIIWSCALTADNKFMTFIEFIDGVEYKIEEFVKEWGSQFTDWFVEQVKSDLEV